MRSHLALNAFKWDLQVEDKNTIAPFALIIPSAIWNKLAGWAEQLSQEALAAEVELLHRPDLWGRLALPPAIRRVLQDRSRSLPPVAARVVRYDFHLTTQGWQISEGNMDVPGGYTEATQLSRWMTGQIAGTRLSGDVTQAIVQALLARVGPSSHWGLLAAPGHLEDQQVVAYLADQLEQQGCFAYRLTPPQLSWTLGQASVQLHQTRIRLDGIFRFYQGEWLAQLPQRRRWQPLFRGGNTWICNPGSALLVESKRFPLVWQQLQTPLPTWNALLPETISPESVNWWNSPDWLLKGAYGNTGDTVMMWGVRDRRSLLQSTWAAFTRPWQWVAQRQFTAIPVLTPAGKLYPCLGVYTVNGKAAGIYGRISPKPLIDYTAMDIAVLIADATNG